MKKIFLFLLILLISGCSTKEDNKVTKDNAIEESKEEIIEEEKYNDGNPIKLGIFLSNNNYSNKEVIKDAYYADFKSGVDIASFEVFFTDDEVINGINFKDVWNRYYDYYTDIDNYKIGYNIKFILSDGTNFEGNFLEPDIYKFSEYFYVYLYDDVHQRDGTIYSHLESMDDDTLITSIKLYAVDGIDKVENIILSAFTYDNEDDFDNDGNYRGNSRYAIRIKRNN